MEDTASNGGEDESQLPRETVLPLIISQLQYYGLNSIAQVVAEASGTPLVFDPQPTLAELCYHGKMARENDDLGDIAPADIMGDLSDADDEGLESLDGDGNGWNDGPAQPPKAAPSLSMWFSTQHREGCRTAAFSTDGKYVATGSEDSSLKVLDVARIKMARGDGGIEKPVIRTLYDHTGPVNDVQFHPNGTVLASCSHDTTIKLFDIQKPNVKRSFRFLQDACVVRSIHFHPSGDFIAAGTDHEAVRIYDVHTLKCFSSPVAADAHTGPINRIRYAPSGRIFATAGEDGSIKIWDAVAGKCTRTIGRAHGGRPVTSVRFSKNGRFVLSCGLDSTGRLWDLHTGAVVQDFVGAVQQDTYTTNTFNHNEELVLGTSQADNAIVVWDSKTGTVLKKIPAHLAPVRCIVASPIENAFVTCSDDYRAKFWGERDQQ
ncbi:cleavage stimulation factor, 3' pre-RNA, subunit 1 [Geranomyces variabilis]|nr:cleavage stimulation factor, 3' pre-RNA, subunit 1 [Geranomyces variabilis]